MAFRVPMKEATKPTEKRTFFATEYGLKKVAGLALGREICLIPIGLEQGIYKTPVHKVKARDGKGFRGLFDTSILCKGYNPETGEHDDSICCQLAQSEKDKYPEKDDYAKRMIGFQTTIVHLPVMVLSANVPESFAGKMPTELLSIKAPQFSFIELANSTFESEIIGGLRKKLEDDEVITYKTTEEEAQALVNKALLNTIIKIKCVPSKTFKYEREFSFIPFYTKKIGAETGEHADIVQYRKNQQLMASVSQYLTLFDSKVDELIVSDWKDSDLIEYVENSSKRQENIDKAISVAEENKLSKAEQTVEFVEDTTEPEPVGEEELTTTLTSDIDESFFNMSEDTDEKVSEPPVVTDDDISFDIDTDDFLSDIEGID